MVFNGFCGGCGETAFGFVGWFFAHLVYWKADWAFRMRDLGFSHAWTELSSGEGKSPLSVGSELGATQFQTRLDCLPVEVDRMAPAHVRDDPAALPIRDRANCSLEPAGEFAFGDQVLALVTAQCIFNFCIHTCVSVFGFIPSAGHARVILIHPVFFFSFAAWKPFPGSSFSFLFRFPRVSFFFPEFPGQFFLKKLLTMFFNPCR